MPQEVPGIFIQLLKIPVCKIYVDLGIILC